VVFSRIEICDDDIIWIRKMHIAGRAYGALAITLTRELAAVGAINAEDMAKMVSQKKLVEDVGGWGKLAP
jgi:hypothetical protein